jgi:very-short-patch-repair endonuclease
MMSHPNLSRAKAMRSEPTEAERAIWSMLRAGRLAGLKFRRQVPVGSYIVDFLCVEHDLVVEIDGSQHAGSERDAARDGYLLAKGFRVLRVWNNDALSNRDGVARTILAAAGMG